MGDGVEPVVGLVVGGGGGPGDVLGLGDVAAFFVVDGCHRGLFMRIEAKEGFETGGGLGRLAAERGKIVRLVDSFARGVVKGQCKHDQLCVVIDWSRRALVACPRSRVHFSCIRGPRWSSESGLTHMALAGESGEGIKRQGRYGSGTD